MNCIWDSMMNSQCGALARILLQSCLVLAFVMQESEADQRDVIARTRLIPQAVKSIEMEYTREGIDAYYRFACEGDQWYFAIYKDNELKPWTEFAFNGQAYETRREGKFLAFSKNELSKHAQIDLHPLILPFSWLTSDPTQLSWQDLAKTQLWDDALEKLEFIRSDIIHGSECDIFRVQQQDVAYEVWISRENAFPMRVIRTQKDSAISSELLVEKLASFGKETYVPVRISLVRKNSSQLPPDSVLASLVSINTETLHVNSPMESQLFSLNSEGVKLVDIDAAKAKDELTSENVQVQQSTPILAIGILIAFLISALVFWRRWQKAK